MVVAAGVEPTLAAFSALCLCRLGYATLVKLAPVAGLAPARARLKDEARGSLHSRAECSRSDSHRHLTDFKSVASALGYGSESGPGGRTRTRTERGLSSLPLRWATPGKNLKWYSRQEFRLQPPRSKRGALYVELQERRRMAASDGFALSTSRSKSGRSAN
jgi:hypothetical protein